MVQPKKKEDLVQDKMTRMPRPELIELIFSCFRRQEHWSLTALREYTQQPVVYLKEVLNEVCTYNKKVHTPRARPPPPPPPATKVL